MGMEDTAGDSEEGMEDMEDTEDTGKDEMFKLILKLLGELDSSYSTGL